MRIAFLYNGAESLGLESISALLRSKGHEVFLAFDPFVALGRRFPGSNLVPPLNARDRSTAERIKAFKPDLAGFSCFSGNYRWSLGIAKALKEELGIPVIFGGVHPTAVPEKTLANDFVDFVVRGEGEFAALDLVAHLESGEPAEKLASIPNLCFRSGGAVRINPVRPYISGLDALPFADKQLFLDAGAIGPDTPYLLITSRGCPYSCTYCSNYMYHELYRGCGAHVRRRSPDNVIAELLHAKEKWNPSKIHFLDDVFTYSGPWLEEFIEKYRAQIALPFYCYANPGNVTKESAALLKKGGCYLAGIGVQSGSERVRREDYGRLETNQRIIETMSYLKENGIRVQADNILGAPSETVEDLERSLRLYRTIKPDIIINFWMTYYPRTKITEKARERGLISAEEISRIEDGFIGYTHDTGSVERKRTALLARYEFLIELSCVFGESRFFPLLSKLAPFIPFKKLIAHLAYMYTSLRHGIR